MPTTDPLAHAMRDAVSTLLTGLARITGRTEAVVLEHPGVLLAEA